MVCQCTLVLFSNCFWQSKIVKVCWTLLWRISSLFYTAVLWDLAVAGIVWMSAPCCLCWLVFVSLVQTRVTMEGDLSWLVIYMGGPSPRWVLQLLGGGPGLYKTGSLYKTPAVESKPISKWCSSMVPPSAPALVLVLMSFNGGLVIVLSQQQKASSCLLAHIVAKEPFLLMKALLNTG